MPFDPTPESPSSRRIILPGEEPPPPPPAPEPATTTGPRIILPPGVRAEERTDLPEYPRLRPLEIVVVREADRDVLVVSDPLGVMPAPIALRAESLELLRLLDGSVSLTDLTTEVVRGSKDLRASGFVRDFVGQLDDLLMLDSPRFEAAYAEIRGAYHQLEIRQAVLGGFSYPEERAELERFVDAHFAEAERRRSQAQDPVAAVDACPRALMVPHLDPRRAGATMARALLELGVEQGAPLRVIIYGTGHSLLGDDLVALTRKHFETPLGRLDCDVAFVDAMVSRMGERAFRAELAHRDEHSIEFLALYLERRFGQQRLRIVPALVGGFHSLLARGQGPNLDDGFEAFVSAVRDTERAQPGPTVHVAAVDLSHVGTRFGDASVDERTAREIEQKDHAALDAARRGDAEGWYRAIAEQEDATRICGWGATYAMLRCAEPSAGRLLAYEQSGEPDGSLVSIAAMAWP